MSRIEPTIPVTAKMYRHFAIITICITACLAMFADGENRQQIENHISKKQNQSRMMNAEQDLSKQGKGGNTRREIVNKRATKGSFGSDEHMPTTLNVGSGTFTSDKPERTLGAPAGYTGGESSADEIVIPSSPPPGMSIAEFEKMRQELLRKKRKQQQRKRNSSRASDNIFDASRDRTQTRRD